MPKHTDGQHKAPICPAGYLNHDHAGSILQHEPGLWQPWRVHTDVGIHIAWGVNECSIEPCLTQCRVPAVRSSALAHKMHRCSCSLRIFRYQLIACVSAVPGKKKRKGIRKEQKELAKLLHRSHLLCLLGRGLLYDQAASDLMLQVGHLLLQHLKVTYGLKTNCSKWGRLFSS